MKTSTEKFLELVDNTDKTNWDEWLEDSIRVSASRKRSRQINIIILYYLKKQGLTQKDLAEKIGVSPQQVSKALKGKSVLSLQTITKMEEALGVKLIEVVGTNDEEVTQNAQQQHTTNLNAKDSRTSLPVSHRSYVNKKKSKEGYEFKFALAC